MILLFYNVYITILITTIYTYRLSNSITLIALLMGVPAGTP